jgi:hypothetical protein
MSNVELEFTDWIAKISERITFLLLNVKEKHDISDDDYAILEFLHRDWYNGVHPLYKTLPNTTAETSVQQGLFADENSDNGVGTLIEESLSAF